MELEAARAAMEEQTLQRQALRGEEEGGDNDDGGRGAPVSMGSYNKVRYLGISPCVKNQNLQISARILFQAF